MDKRPVAAACRQCGGAALSDDFVHEGRGEGKRLPVIMLPAVIAGKGRGVGAAGSVQIGAGDAGAFADDDLPVFQDQIVAYKKYFWGWGNRKK